MVDLKDEVFMTTGQVARHLGVSERLVRLLNETGELPAIRSPGSYRLYNRRDVEAVAEKRRTTPKKKPGRPRGSKNKEKAQ